MYQLRNTRTGDTDRSYRTHRNAVKRWYELGGRAQGWRIFDDDRRVDENGDEQ